MKASSTWAAIYDAMFPLGLALLFGVGARPPQDGIRRMGRVNL